MHSCWDCYKRRHDGCFRASKLFSVRPFGCLHIEVVVVTKDAAQVVKISGSHFWQRFDSNRLYSPGSGSDLPVDILQRLSGCLQWNSRGPINGSRSLRKFWLSLLECWRYLHFSLEPFSGATVSFIPLCLSLFWRLLLYNLHASAQVYAIAWSFYSAQSISKSLSSGLMVWNADLHRAVQNYVSSVVWGTFSPSLVSLVAVKSIGYGVLVFQ